MSEFNCGWETPSEFPDLPENSVHIWQVCINDHYDRVNVFERSLDKSEKERANQFKFNDTRSDFIICRGVLRFLLSRNLNEKPNSIDLIQEPDGKPGLANDFDQHALKFNISHSKKICLIALSPNLEVGVDVEELKPLSDLDNMARSFLSENEYTDFLSCLPENKLNQFYSLWSAKEALVKAIGCGLIIPPKQIEINEIREKKKFTARYFSSLIEMPLIEMIPLDGLNGYAAWLVIAGKVEKITTFRLTRQLMAI